jgi:hypothetical protein
MGAGELALDRSGNVYVANENTVRAFSPSGKDLGVFVSAGLSEPFGLAFDATGNLFVSNGGDNTVREFSPTGQELGVVVSLLGIGCPSGLAVDRTGNLLVADLCRSQILAFSPTGEGLGVFASAGLSNPLALAFDAAGDVFVSNTDNGGAFANTIHEFSPTGRDLGTFASTGLRFPGGMAFDRRGNLLVADEEQRPGRIDYAIRGFSAGGADLGDVIVLPAQPEFLVVVPSTPPGPPPSCALTAVVAGPPKQLKITVQSSGVGLASIQVTEAKNASVDVPRFAQGDTGIVVVVATKVDQGAGAQVALSITDTSGQVTNCDPIVPGDPATAAPAASGCNVANGSESSALSCLTGALLGLGLILRRRSTPQPRQRSS